LLNALKEQFCEQLLAAAEPPTDQVNSRSSHLQVLVAEDNEINQRVIRGLLNKLGIEPIVANDGKEAFRYFCDRQSGDKPFDLILMDCEMPQVDGYEATRMIRNHEIADGSHVDIVALTASVLPEHRKKAAEMGMDEFLTKPIRLAELQHLLSSL
jgi:CheY-like chemotaxis protein